MCSQKPTIEISSKELVNMHPFQKQFFLDGSTSDKLSHHGYHRIYPWFLGHFRDQKVQLLEIGIHQTESIKLWRGYFNDVSIHGIDIDEKQFDDPNVKLYKVDQSQETDLRKFAKTVNTSFDIIIDDGSHVPSHQILTLKHLWPLLAPGGVYIVEDVETSYWGKSNIYGYDFNSNQHDSNFIRFSSSFIDQINQEFSGSQSDQMAGKGVGDEIEMVSFAYNCVILIKKDPSSFSSFYDRKYRFLNEINSRSLYKRIKNRVKRLLA